ncbi:tRNA pseudouridine(38-40) synthase TruA [Salinirubellus salinus]|uniref:tRNA pseudouridine synthase A n=1 Tax=Salinirubellus salinus TaxID=1364945 RepID=A0A9E7QZT0_9EURY|nr:tRNA pseudouridine(38-40) synthase TruA [Salinirubellus salinus]UWM53060.1 tRNA pseudouridine(38-40) synthase TruA [Salinirubellus salinus]
MRAYRLAYDGTCYRGFQRQPHGQTVEDELFGALADLGVAEGKPEGYAAAGRTDRGVSALAQTVALAAPEWLTPRALNSRLPASIRAWAHADVDEGFSARYDATERVYRYHLYAPADAVDDARARAACDGLSGRHDFHDLTLDAEGTVRDLAVSVERDGAFLTFDLRAQGFARQLVRRVVSLVALVARGERPVSFVDRVLAPDPLSGADGVPPAPPAGLVLLDVTYPDCSFVVDGEAAASAREVFEERRVDAATRARTFGTVGDALDVE